MKLSPKHFVKVVASLVFVALLASPAAAQNAVERTALVMALTGDAKYSPNGGAFVPLAIGTKLHKGDTIKTGASSHVDIDMGSNVGLVQVAPMSTFVVQTITSTKTQTEELTETQVAINAGAIYFKVNKLAKGSRFEISSPKGIAGIRGTDGYADAEGRFTLEAGLGGAAYPNGAGGVDAFVVKGGETVGPNDKPPHPAPPQDLRDVVLALRDAATHGVGFAVKPFVPALQPFISPTLPPNPVGGLIQK